MTKDGSHALEFGDELLSLLPERAIWWPGQEALVLSDVHFGKSATFRAQGIPVPEGESREDLVRINQLLERYPAQRLVIAGDFFHSAAPLAPWLNDLLVAWVDMLRVELTLVRGNHDPSFFHSFTTTKRLELGSLLFVHDPVDAPSGVACVTGHLHPLCRIGKAGRASRVPCFLHSGSCLILPAFGTFTSGAIMQPDERRSFFPVVGGKVYSL
ncbi:MAG: DEAD/DEAH box helicase [Roseibacillus sp.]|nr:DEAD/DEAH box helicase [Roseibacillus sp.]